MTGRRFAYAVWWISPAGDEQKVKQFTTVTAAILAHQRLTVADRKAGRFGQYIVRPTMIVAAVPETFTLRISRTIQKDWAARDINTTIPGMAAAGWEMNELIHVDAATAAQIATDSENQLAPVWGQDRPWVRQAHRRLLNQIRPTMRTPA